MDIKKAANEARKSISNFCIEECKAYCCRKGFLAVSTKESDLITNGRTKELEKSGILIKKEEGSYALDLRKSCPSLKDFKCVIHANPERPTVCKEFPVFIEGNSVRLVEKCPAVRKKLLYSYEAQFLEMGYMLL